jgi:diaminopimelate epimerase
MKIPFSKLHGAKNDFLITSTADVHETHPAELAVAICERHTGVGADGWIILDRTKGPDYDASIRIFNSDGSEPEVSGNGTRCAALLLAREGADSPIRIRTGAGVKELRLLSEIGDGDVQFEMDMGHLKVIDLHARIHGFDAVILDVGNPQCAVAVDDFEFDWRSAGAAIEHDPRFPNRTNVSFVRKVDRHTIDVRFWERGAGETNSSGTGSTGAALAAVARGSAESPVTVLTPAGALTVRFDAETACLTGPARFIADGVFHYGKIK